MSFVAVATCGVLISSLAVWELLWRRTCHKMGVAYERIIFERSYPDRRGLATRLHERHLYQLEKAVRHRPGVPYNEYLRELDRLFADQTNSADWLWRLSRVNHERVAQQEAGYLCGHPQWELPVLGALRRKHHLRQMKAAHPALVETEIRSRLYRRYLVDLRSRC